MSEAKENTLAVLERELAVAVAQYAMAQLSYDSLRVLADQANRRREEFGAKTHHLRQEINSFEKQ